MNARVAGHALVGALLVAGAMHAAGAQQPTRPTTPTQPPVGTTPAPSTGDRRTDKPADKPADRPPEVPADRPAEPPGAGVAVASRVLLGAQRFEIVQVRDTTFDFLTTGVPWVRDGMHGLAVDPRRRDALVARFEVRSTRGDTATAIVTGQTMRVTTDHFALIEAPPPAPPPAPRPVARGHGFWLGALAGAVLGLVGGLLIP